MLAIAIGITMAVLDSSVANVALPTIARQLHATPAQATWVINAYQLATVVTLLPFAALGERLGYRRIYLYGLLVFTAGSLACALSHSLLALVVSRVVQGIGASGIMSMNGALVRYTYPQATLGRGVGLNALVVSFAAAIGPTVASGILSIGSWEWLFAVNVPLGLVNLVLASRALPGSPLADRRLDWLSAALNALLFGLFFIGADGFAHGKGRQQDGRQQDGRQQDGRRRDRGPRDRGGARGRRVAVAEGAPRAPAPDPARPLQGARVHALGRRLDLRLHGLHAGLPVAAVLLRADARPRCGPDRPADDGLAGGARRVVAGRRMALGSLAPRRCSARSAWRRWRRAWRCWR